MRNGKPKFFTRLAIRNYLNVNTYIGVKWLVLDEQSGKQMHVNMSSNFVSRKTTRYKRFKLYITIPSKGILSFQIFKVFSQGKDIYLLLGRYYAFKAGKQKLSRY